MPARTDPMSCRESPRVRGRFAPSPSGALHFGSLVAAVASYLDARSRGGEWLVRIEDLDPPREVPGAGDTILRMLEAFGLEWDGPVRYQSRHHASYAAAIERLAKAGNAYPCSCTRREIAQIAAAGIDGPVYPGTCRRGVAAGRRAHAWRLRVPQADVLLNDEVFGQIGQNVAREVGDFVLRRSDGLFAYQLAVVVDDAGQAITRVVRGADLLDSTQRQMVLQRMLGLPTPDYLHVPVAINRAGEKLSKQTRSKSLDARDRSPVLIAALRFLSQAPPQELSHTRPREILNWASANWRPQNIAPQRAQEAPSEHY